MANVDSSSTPTTAESTPNPNTTPSIQGALPEVKTRRKTDPARGYCTQIIEDGRKKIKCTCCDAKFLGGGIHRFKEHLAKWLGNVDACSKVDPEVEHTMYQNIKDWNAKKNKGQELYEEGHPYGPEPIEVEEAACEAPTRRVVRTTRKRGATTPSVGKYFKPRTNPGYQPTIKSVLQGEEVTLKTDLCVARRFVDASIPFHASNSIFYQPMLDAACSYGGGYKGPNFNKLRGSLLEIVPKVQNNY